MKHQTFNAVPRVRRATFAALLLALLAGCSTTKPDPVYMGAADQQQRQAAEQAASPGTGPNATVNNVSTYLKLVEQMQRDGLWFASLAHIDSLEQRWGVSAESTRLRADALRQTDQLAESRKFYGKLMGTPLEAAGYHGLGLLAGAESDFGGAVKMLELAQRRTPTDGMLLSDLGYAQLRAGRTAQARLPLMQAFQLQPDSPQVQANLALYLLVSGQPDQARALMDARNMPAATRSAIDEGARQLAGSATAPKAAAQTASTAHVALASIAPARTALTSDADPGLTLKPASWVRRSTTPEAPPSTVLPLSTGARP